MPMTEQQLLARDAKRNIGAELLLSVRQMKAAQGRRVACVDHATGKPVFNRVTGLKDSWGK
jgi:hypothetical protein